MSRETSTLVSAFIMSERRLLLERDVGLFLRHVRRCEPDTPGALLFIDNRELLAFAVHSSEILGMVSFLFSLLCRPFEVNCVLCRDFVVLTPANRSSLSSLIQLRQLLGSLSADKSFMDDVYDSVKDLANGKDPRLAYYKAVYNYYNQTQSTF